MYKLCQLRLNAEYTMFKGCQCSTGTFEKWTYFRITYNGYVRLHEILCAGTVTKIKQETHQEMR